MRVYAFFLAASLLVPALAAGRDSPPTILVQALHCIKAGDRDWLTSPLSERKRLLAGFNRDRKSHPGEDHLIVIVYQDATTGQAFDVSMTKRGGQTAFRVENNGGFAVVKSKIEFVDPPLGGVWTQEHLQSNIAKAWRSHKFSISVNGLTGSFPKVACSSYVGAQRQ